MLLLVRSALDVLLEFMTKTKEATSHGSSNLCSFDMCEAKNGERAPRVAHAVLGSRDCANCSWGSNAKQLRSKQTQQTARLGPATTRLTSCLAVPSTPHSLDERSATLSVQKIDLFLFHFSRETASSTVLV